MLILLPVSLMAQEFGGNPAGIRWRQVVQPGGTIIFPAGLDSQASRISRVLEALNQRTAKTIGNKTRSWNIILQNQTTISNAYVRMAPVMSEFYMTAEQDNFSTGSLRWDDNLVIHEVRHMQQLANFYNGLSKVFGFFLGQEGRLLATGLVIPDYFLEGDAVWQETLVSEQGRGRLPHFYNGFKSMWLGNRNYNWMKLRSGSLRHYTPDHYELGYLLTAYGNATYGADFWQKVTADATRFKGLFFAFNKAIERHSGKPYTQFRKDALEFFKQQAIPVGAAENKGLQFISSTSANNVTDYEFPVYISPDSILVSKKSYREVSAFYFLVKGKEHRIRTRNSGLDQYYSYRNGRIVYASYQSDPRRANRDYSVIQLLNIYNGKQRQISFRSKYFSPDINETGTEILAVSLLPNGQSSLHRINAQTGSLVSKLPNAANYFFTQTKYINDRQAISAVRNPQGQMALVRVNLADGLTEPLTTFSYNVLGYPFIKGDTVYFTAMQNDADKLFALRLSDKKLFRITDNINGMYAPTANDQGQVLASAFTADGYRLARVTESNWEEATPFGNITDLYTPALLKDKGAGLLKDIPAEKLSSKPYKKTFRLFNLHSWRPVANDPEYGYSLYSDDVLSRFSNSLTYTYNRNERSHTVGFAGAYGGWFPVLALETEASFNRTFDTAVGKSIMFNSALLKSSASVPLRFVGGRYNAYLNIGLGFNAEQLYYFGIGKNILENDALHYGNVYISFSRFARQARQQVNPRWGQSISLGYRHAFDYRDSRKFVANSNFYFPGLSGNHSFVVNASLQQRDTLPDLFSNTFSYSRGYDALSTRSMYKLGANYQFPLLYPDWGFGNMIFFQRIRANAFFDYTSARARLNGQLTDIVNRSAGGELFFDTKVWNALPLSFGVRYARLLDTNLRNPSVQNRWEFIVPIGFVPD